MPFLLHSSRNAGGNSQVHQKEIEMPTNPYPHLTSSMKVGRTYYKNRVFFSSHNQPFCRSGGMITDEGIAYYEARAKGGCAQVSLGETPVDGIHAFKGDLEEHLQINVEPTYAFRIRMGKLVTAIHAHNCKLGIQLLHAGQAATDPIGPVGFVREDGVEVQEMDEGLMQEVIKGFVDSATMARRLGFDQIQIHGGHGWLLSQFVSPLYNKRTDEYGGSLENRLRFPIRVLKAVREAIGPNMILEYRISGAEFVEGGYTNEEACEICAGLDPYVDTFQISAGVYQNPDTRMYPTIFDPHCLNCGLAANIKKHVTKPVIAVGSIMTPEQAEDLIASGAVDFVAMARTLIAEPEFVNKCITGRRDELIPCIRCFNCMSGSTGFLGPSTQLQCTMNPRTGLESWIPEHLPKTESPKKIVAIGGGPGGLAAAIFGREAGHEVIVFEKGNKLGGNLLFTDLDEHKFDLKRGKDFLVDRALKSGAEIRTNCEATPENVMAEKPDVIIAATGSEPLILPLPGMDRTIEPLDVYHMTDEELGDTVLFIGGGLVGCETAYSAACRGKKVIIVEMLDRLASEDTMNANNMKLFKKLDEYGAEIYLNTRCLGAEEGGITVMTADGDERFIAADTIVSSAGRRPKSSEAYAFEDCAPMLVPVGDCVKIGKILQAIRSVYFTIGDLG